jgi:hypothetical protein
MSIRVRRPVSDRLDLSDGDYLIVKQDLTAGEFRELMRASSRPVAVTPDVIAGATAGQTPNIQLDPIAAGLATVVAYLLDWSFEDAEGRKIVIADQPASVVRSALDHIDSAAYLEVQGAIMKHQTARAEQLAEEKKTRSGAPARDRILTSVG